MPTNTQPKKRAKRRIARQWRAIIRRCEKSNLTASEFCHKQGISLPIFRRWQRKQLAEVSVPGFVELQPPTVSSQPETPWILELDLPGGGHLRIKSGL